MSAWMIIVLLVGTAAVVGICVMAGLITLEFRRSRQAPSEPAVPADRSIGTHRP